MKKLYITLCLIILTLAGCGQGLAPPISDEPPVEGPSASEADPNTSETDTDAEYDPYIIHQDPFVFDFAILPEEDFPHGAWTINQLASVYGEPKSVKSDAYFIVTAIFDDAQVMLTAINRNEDVENFSFYNEVNEELSAYSLDMSFLDMEFDDLDDFLSFYDESGGGLSAYEYTFEAHINSLEYNLNDADKDLELRVSNLRIFDVNTEFPYEIRIGESTKTQIVDQYPADSWYSNDSEWLSYRYDFRDENGDLPDDRGGMYGSIRYIFDDDEILREVSIWWHWFSA